MLQRLLFFSKSWCLASSSGIPPESIMSEVNEPQVLLSTIFEAVASIEVCGADCVKFQKSNLSEKFTESALSRSYEGPHSWGKTYGEHKRHLEFSTDEFRELQNYAQQIGILFTASAMDPDSLTFLDSLNVPFIKIGSGDSDNMILIEEAAKLNKPLVISTGMTDIEGVKRIYETVTHFHKQLVLLHCVSAYPTPVHDVNLRVIQEYQRLFPDVVIGYSGHELGVVVTTAAVALGAKIVERHLTLDKGWKGSDHVCSLDPSEFKLMVENIRTVEAALGSGVKQFLACERPCHEKLGKSLVAAEDLAEGSVITRESVKVKVNHPLGVSCRYLDTLVGRELLRPVGRDCAILLPDVADVNMLT